MPERTCHTRGMPAQRPHGWLLMNALGYSSPQSVDAEDSFCNPPVAQAPLRLRNELEQAVPMRSRTLLQPIGQLQKWN